MKLIIFNAKYFGPEEFYDYIPFPADEYSIQTALKEFKRVKRYDRYGYPYEAYEYNGKLYYSVKVAAIVDEEEFYRG